MVQIITNRQVVKRLLETVAGLTLLKNLAFLPVE